MLARTGRRVKPAHPASWPGLAKPKEAQLVKALKATAAALGGLALINGLFWLVMHIAAETGIKNLVPGWDEVEP